MAEAYINTLLGPELQRTKRCNKCKRDLPLSAFGRHSGANYLRPECRECARKLARQVAPYRNLQPPHNHKCPSCGATEEEARLAGVLSDDKRVWCLDHDHETGEMRGWICQTCNKGLGLFKDNPHHMLRTIKYITEFLKSRSQYAGLEKFIDRLLEISDPLDDEFQKVLKEALEFCESRE